MVRCLHLTVLSSCWNFETPAHHCCGLSLPLACFCGVSCPHRTHANVTFSAFLQSCTSVFPEYSMGITMLLSLGSSLLSVLIDVLSHPLTKVQQPSIRALISFSVPVLLCLSLGSMSLKQGFIAHKFKLDLYLDADFYTMNLMVNYQKSSCLPCVSALHWRMSP